MVVPEDEIFWIRIREAVKLVEAYHDRVITFQMAQQLATIKFNSNSNEIVISINNSADSLKKQALIVP